MQCDVCDDGAQERLVRAHCEAYGSLDIAILNAGIYERGLPLALHRTLLKARLLSRLGLPALQLARLGWHTWITNWRPGCR